MMHISAFDSYRLRKSPIHRLNARIKVIITVLFILSNVLLPDGAWLAFLGSWLFILAISAFSRLGIGYAFKRSFVALPFALVALTTLFSVPGPALVTLHLASWQLVVTEPGLVRFLTILCRSWLSVQMAILLVATTQFPPSSILTPNFSRSPTGLQSQGELPQVSHWHTIVRTP